jgi:hypothetical protein
MCKDNNFNRNDKISLQEAIKDIEDSIKIIQQSLDNLKEEI